MIPIMTPLLSSLVLTALLFSGCSPSQTEINGEVFIVTKGGDNMKLGLVQIMVFKPAVILSHINKRKEFVKAETSRINKAADLGSMTNDDYAEQSYMLNSGEPYFQDMPTPIITAQTNSDGKFTLTLPNRGSFVLAAHAHRELGDRLEDYYWLINVSPNGTSHKTIMLSNNNMTSSGAPESAVQTVK
jgi:hypothetical protein